MKQDENFLKLKVFDWKIFCFWLPDFGNLMGKICLTFDSFSSHGWKLSNYVAKFRSHFSIIIHKSFRLKQNLTNNYDSIWNVANSPQISWYILAYYLDFIQLWYILLTFGFAFGPFKSSNKDFGLFQNGSKFQNFGLGNGEIWKSQSITITY